GGYNRPLFRSSQEQSQMAYHHIKVPSGGEKLRVRKDFSLEVPDRPIIPYIEGDGTGIDITPVMLKVVDAAVQKAYGGKKKIDWPAQSAEARKVIDFLMKEMKVKKIRFPETSAIGIKPISIEGSERLIRRAYQYAIDNQRKSVTLVHKGNIQKFTEGGFRDWGYKLAQKEFDAKPIDGGPWHSFKNPKGGPDIVVKDVITDA